ncbi:hypothetical protein UP10_20335 [Bradyrhizobium sp. LTSPM299]|jgi:hypothetical protein|uniref:hypothetical protein n=1 Tax=Bradyrhizobium sp. LTSPM299 TaxID=1619233 RepID=UPI0005CAB826|nr:hypothetical protein [Bradyrhizobium sp. LTSPM299]KJC58968.1 hypothetical protein UP10_20335 [Bradyrhizobium sp. LTSPM299]
MALVYSFVALWVGVVVILGFWVVILRFKMESYRLEERPWPGGRRFAFQTDPADYSEMGQACRRKSVRVELALLVWGPVIPIAVTIAFGK